MQCRMDYTQLISYFENEYKYLLSDYEHILMEEERDKNQVTDDTGTQVQVLPIVREELPSKDGVI